ncbi:hypothetical protein ACU4GD_41200 [Cupriavidus basilensis]
MIAETAAQADFYLKAAVASSRAAAEHVAEDVPDTGFPLAV